MALDRRTKRPSLLDRVLSGIGLRRGRTAASGRPSPTGRRTLRTTQATTGKARLLGLKRPTAQATPKPTGRFRDLPPIQKAQARDRIKQMSRRIDPLRSSGGGPGM